MDAPRTTFRAGEIIFREGDPPTVAFLIESGRVQISTFQNGELTVLGGLGSGALFGEMAVMDDSPRTATARAVSDCVLTPIDRSQFAERLASADPVVYALMLSQLSRYRSALVTLTGNTAGAQGGQDPLDTSDSRGEGLALGKIRLESELRSALSRDELDVRLQPIQELASGAISGYEALVRWQHPVRGQVSPSEFIRLAEETSLIVPVGEYVLGRVCDMLARLRERDGDALPFIALNISARQLYDSGLLDRILAQLRARHLPPDRLKLEITESLILDPVPIRALLDRCHAVGMHVALDDFGTGYSNLGPLLTLHFDQIKLDRTFVHALDQPRGVAVTRAILAMANTLGCDVIAEGVEFEAQRDTLRELGCRYAQGWLVGKPRTLAEVLGD